MLGVASTVMGSPSSVTTETAGPLIVRIVPTIELKAGICVVTGGTTTMPGPVAGPT